MAPDDRSARADADRDLDAVTVADDAPEDRARRGGPGRSPRRWLPLVALAVPVVAVVAVLGARAAAGGEFDPDAAGARVSAASDGLMTSEDGYGFASSSVGWPTAPLGGGSSDAPGGARDVTVVCASQDARGARLTVTSGGEVVGEADVACSNGADPDADPLITVLPLDDLRGSWSYEVVPESQAAVAVVVS